ncbi:MAG TPA: M14 metallopeptidase family protein [Rubricoccaceae bacterium]
MRLGLAALCLLCAAAGAHAQVPSPAEFLGYELGERFTPHHRVLAYVEAVAAASPRVSVETYGETVEGRPLVALTVAAPETLDRIDAVRESGLRAAGVLPGGGEPEKAVVWLSYNVHGNEAVSTEAAMETLYALAGGDPRAEAWLRDVVVVLDPCLNPDGRERYVSGFTQRVGARPDASPEAREHAEPWPGGRTNHYLFDLNRDWAWGTQPETRARLALYDRWLPHVHVDFHEQGVDSPYYFAPAAEPFHARITPWQRDLQTRIGAGNAAVFDREGWLYFTREVFDLFYPGYGDTWPTFNGAVGMTYEQGGSGRAGLAIVTAERDTLTLADRIGHHTASGLATVETTARNAAQVRSEFAAYFRRPLPDAVRAYAVRGDAGRLAALAGLLDLQGIRYGWADREQTVRGVRYAGGLVTPSDAGRQTVRPGDLVVSLSQPKGTLAAVLFEPSPPLADSVTYDVTAWALPYVYNVEGFALEGDVSTSARPAVPDPPLLPERPYAYLARWESPADAALLAGLLRAGVGVRRATEPFESGGERFGPGTLVLTRAGNDRIADFDAVVRAAAGAAGRPLWAVGSGFVTSGPDFGSGRVGFLRAPRVVVVADAPVSATALGEVWHLFDQTLRYPATLVDADDVDGALDDADVLVLPDGRYRTWLTDARAERLLTWVRGGGRLVAMEGAVAALAGRDGFGLAAARTAERDTTTEARLRPFGSRERRAAGESLPGSVHRVQIDATHPLGFGSPGHTYTLKQSTAAYPFLATGWNVGVLRDATPVAGFAGRGARERLDDTLVFGVQDVGAGAVVYFVDDPLFRGFWADGQLLFANAVFAAGTD